MSPVLNPDSPVEYWFERISAIPRESEHEEKISDFLTGFASERKLWVYRDDMHNVVIRKPASPGYEDHPTVILQGHTDMVCSKTAESSHNFRTDPIELQIENGFLRAKDTSLGADDGVAVAYMLAILDSGTQKHPPLECVFTSQEETTNAGAIGLDKSILTGTRIIGMDGDGEDTTFVSCFCSDLVELNRYYPTTLRAGVPVTVRLDDFYTGVYQGVRHPDCANVIRMGARLLERLAREGISFRLARWNAGIAENRNPFTGELTLLAEGTEAARLREAVEDEFSELLKEFGEDKYSGTCTVTAGELERAECLSPADSTALAHLITLLPNNMAEENGIGNIGLLRLEAGRAEVQLTLRSRTQGIEDRLLTRCRAAAELCGYSFRYGPRFSSWPYRADSPLRTLANRIMKERYGKTMAEEVCPGGLELGWFYRGQPDFDALQLGPDITGQHTPDERLNLESFHRIYRLICSILEEL